MGRRRADTTAGSDARNPGWGYALCADTWPRSAQPAERALCLLPDQSPAAEVSVSGAATVDQTLNVRIDPSPWFKAIVDQALQNSQTLVPLIGNGTGAMDSDAGPHRSGPAGIGRM